MTSLTLSFNDVNFTPVEQGGQIWLTAGELARALGYAKANAVTQVYERNQDEFNSSMTNVINLNSAGSVGSLNLRLPKKEHNLVKTVRIFSLRGAHLIAMFSKTAIAKQFRKWVLDVLDREVLSQNIESRQTITPEQKDTLHKIIDHKVNGNQGLRAQVWTRHNRHFKINSYHELLKLHFDDSVKYLLEMEVKQKTEKPEIKSLPYPKEVIHVAHEINNEFLAGRFDSWFVSAKNGVLSVMPLPHGYYPFNVKEFTKHFDGVLNVLYGSDTLQMGRFFLANK